jgi:hypothetical protein
MKTIRAIVSLGRLAPLFVAFTLGCAGSVAPDHASISRAVGPGNLCCYLPEPGEVCTQPPPCGTNPDPPPMAPAEKTAAAAPPDCDAVCNDDQDPYRDHNCECCQQGLAPAVCYW